jgi:hypothetical protein
MEMAMKLMMYGSLLPLALAGCAGAVDAPSLAIRPREKAVVVDPNAPPVVPLVIGPPPTTPLDSTATARLMAVVDRAKTSITNFETALRPASVAADKASGAPIGSDAWIAAQLEITRLERLRAPVTEALAEIDSLKRELIAKDQNVDQLAIDAMVAIVAKVDQDQQDSVAALLAKLKR